jgi:hypothetical protein
VAYWLYVRLRDEAPGDQPVLIPLHDERELAQARLHELERQLDRGDEWFDYGGGRRKAAEIQSLHLRTQREALDMAAPFGGLDA